MISLRNHGLITVLTYAYLVSLLPKFNWIRAIILVPIVLYTMVVLDKLHPKIEIFRFSFSDKLIASLSAIPYLFIIIYITRDFTVLIPIALLLLSLYFFHEKKSMWGNVIGTAFVSSLSFIFTLFLGNPLYLITPFFWTLYTFTQALYVEYKIPYRKVSSKPMIVSWISSLLFLSILSFYLHTPLMLLALIEPSIRFFNPGQKLKSPKEIRNLGWSGMKRDALFVIVIMITSYFSL